MNLAPHLRFVPIAALLALPLAPVAVDASPVAPPPSGGELRFELGLPRAVVEEIVRVRLALRDLAFRANTRLTSFAYRVGLRTPDVTVLTTEPIAALTSLGASSGFGWRDDPMRHRAKFHSGADVRAKSGTAVFAAGDGVVVFSGYRGGYGNFVAVDHGGGVITRYGHLRRIDARKDAVVTAGQPIGQVGMTGRTTGPHLHFEVLLDGKPVDPVLAMTVADAGRDSPLAGTLASFALAPELQAEATSRLDPPKQPRSKQKPTKSTRPDRPGYVKRVRPVS
jgi:murein DD-endopeptidase MepM/ murein hydrolase activator NlpD